MEKIYCNEFTYMALRNVYATDFTVRKIYKVGLNLPLKTDIDEKLKNKYDAISKDHPQREVLLKKLAEKNCLEAIIELYNYLPSRARTKYKLRAAMLGHDESAKDLGWEKRGFNELSFEICARSKKLRIQKNHPSSSGIVISAKTIIKEFSFNVIEENTDKWLDFYNALSNKKIEPSPFWIPPQAACIPKEELNVILDRKRGIAPSHLQSATESSIKNTFSESVARNEESEPRRRLLTVPATPQNLNVIMKNADILPVSVKIKFPNNQEINTEFIPFPQENREK